MIAALRTIFAKVKRMAAVLPAFAVWAVASAEEPSVAASFAGMDGRGMLELLRTDWRPTRPVASADDVVRLMSVYCRQADGSYRDYFSASAAKTLQPVAVAQLSWWGESSADYNIVANDLHNMVAGNSAVAANRSDFPPGTVTKPLYDNGYWKSGIGEIGGYETNFHEPADELKGDFARIYMYAVAVYPQDLWRGRATMLYADGYYPLLTAYGRDLLLGWHRADPVDDAELERDSAIEAAQGRSNPFVRWPDLAEYIWGRHSDEVYDPSPGGETPEEPENPEEPDKPDDPDDPVDDPIMLKAVYSVSADGRIDFRSPYVASGSEWTLDGRAVTTVSVKLEEVGIGRHEVTYSNERSRGKVIINVEP